MELANRTAVQEFIFLGFGNLPQKRIPLFIFFTILYMFTLAENLTIITVVVLDTRLSRLPMYILLSNFSFLEMCYVSSTVPRMLFDLASPAQGIISFRDCFLQYYFLFSLGSTECFFLSSMALDRYLAICHPLRYPQIMSPNFCYTLLSACCVLGFLWQILPVVLISKLSFCGPNIIDHFLCDAGQLLSLACPPVEKLPLVCQIVADIVVILGNFFFVILSYGAVVVTLLKTSRKGSRLKAFSTIFFHLLVVMLFYGPVAAMYVIPGGEHHSDVTKAVTLFYTAVTPFLNPLIYCLRNDQVKEALRKLWRGKFAEEKRNSLH